MSRYVSVNVDVDVNLGSILDGMSSAELEDLANELIADGYGTAPKTESSTANLDDSVVLLDVITGLRTRGFSVEPTTRGV